MCLISSLKDAAIFIRDNENLFIQKVREVVIMGGVELPIMDENPLKPDTAHNNQFDTTAADFIWKRLQELSVPIVCTTRHCAYAAQVPRGIYDQLALTGSPIGVHLRQKQRDSIEGLWQRAVSGGSARNGLPSRCNKAWFQKAFCGGNPEVVNRNIGDVIWDLVISASMSNCAR